uniref:Uncharacterized protein n=1 Tax=Nelumbo nucifera TaxID=4432 RepID=A0A822YHC4_NELNU|nr:TPA_asm: hypothetical protein HUJ06_009712 [Nelumbo nucifera]
MGNSVIFRKHLSWKRRENSKRRCDSRLLHYYVSHG